MVLNTPFNILPAHKVIIIATGAQGEEFAALNRIANDRHPHIRLVKGDTVVFSSSIIPGNEIAVQKLRDLLFYSETQLITYRTSDVHATGHGCSGELVWINKMIGARYFVPGYGFRSMTYAHAQAVIAAGVLDEDHVFFGRKRQRF